MGYSTALGIAESDISLEAQVSWHFSSNCYPPVPQYMVPLAVEAIHEAVEGNWGNTLECPEGVTFRDGNTVSVSDIINTLHLDAFVEVALDKENNQ